jgi:hypothetical protein
MTEAEFLTRGGIPLERLSEDENRILAQMVEAVWKAAQFDRVSYQRTEMLARKAMDVGVDPAQAARLARHFNAATEYVQSLPEAQRRHVCVALEQTFGPVLL